MKDTTKSFAEGVRETRELQRELLARLATEIYVLETWLPARKAKAYAKTWAELKKVFEALSATVQK